MCDRLLHELSVGKKSADVVLTAGATWSNITCDNVPFVVLDMTAFVSKNQDGRSQRLVNKALFGSPNAAAPSAEAAGGGRTAGVAGGAKAAAGVGSKATGAAGAKAATGGGSKAAGAAGGRGKAARAAGAEAVAAVGGNKAAAAAGAKVVAAVGGNKAAAAAAAKAVAAVGAKAVGVAGAKAAAAGVGAKAAGVAVGAQVAAAGAAGTAAVAAAPVAAGVGVAVTVAGLLLVPTNGLLSRQQAKHLERELATVKSHFGYDPTTADGGGPPPLAAEPQVLLCPQCAARRAAGRPAHAYGFQSKGLAPQIFRRSATPRA